MKNRNRILENGNGDTRNLSLSAPFTYSSSVTPEEVLGLANEPVVFPEHNKSYIQSIARSKGAGGEVDVRTYHENLLSEQNAELRSNCLHLEGQLASEVGGINRQIEDISRIHKDTNPYQESMVESTPWTRWDKGEVGVLAVVSIGSIWVGNNNIAQVLHASGIPGFESWMRCYMFSAIPVGLAFLFKGVGRLFSQPKAKTIYLALIWVCALIFGAGWVFLFAQTFPGFTQSVSDIINSLSVTQTQSGRASEEGKWLIFYAVFAEAFLAAGCWLTIERIAARHESSKRTSNPAYERTQADLNHWIKRRYQQEKLRSQIQGKIRRIEDAKRCFGDEAVGYFNLAIGAANELHQINNLFNV